AHVRESARQSHERLACYRGCLRGDWLDRDARLPSTQMLRRRRCLSPGQLPWCSRRVRMYGRSSSATLYGLERSLKLRSRLTGSIPVCWPSYCELTICPESGNRDRRTNYVEKKEAG